MHVKITKTRGHAKNNRARGHLKNTRARKIFFEGTRILSWGTRGRKIVQGTRARGQAIFISGHEGT